MVEICKSNLSHAFGISGLDEARAYLAHPVLSARLVEICEALLSQKKKKPEDIFGYTDAVKLCSSMTLFALVSEDGSVFHKVLKRFYHGLMDARTLELVNKALTTDLTIYSSGLRGNNGLYNTKKHGLRTKKHKKHAKKAKNQSCVVWDVDAAGSNPVTSTT